MSVKRQVSTIYDLDTLKKVAQELYFEVKENAKVRGYGGSYIVDENGNDIIADLVVLTHGDSYDIGFIQNEDGTVDMICDEHGNYARKKLQELLPAYLKEKLEGRFEIEEEIKSTNKVRLYLRR